MFSTLKEAMESRAVTFGDDLPPCDTCGEIIGTTVEEIRANRHHTVIYVHSVRVSAFVAARFCSAACRTQWWMSTSETSLLELGTQVLESDEQLLAYVVDTAGAEQFMRVEATGDGGLRLIYDARYIREMYLFENAIALLGWMNAGESLPKYRATRKDFERQKEAAPASFIYKVQPSGALIRVAS